VAVVVIIILIHHPLVPDRQVDQVEVEVADRLVVLAVRLRHLVKVLLVVLAVRLIAAAVAAVQVP
jgi:hypothetical protein|tara:strand:- start:712 stop:906 length:195 start_codon:yes stop_codon:yes gene_type:complete